MSFDTYLSINSTIFSTSRLLAHVLTTVHISQNLVTLRSHIKTKPLHDNLLSDKIQFSRCEVITEWTEWREFIMIPFTTHLIYMPKTRSRKNGHRGKLHQVSSVIM